MAPRRGTRRTKASGRVDGAVMRKGGGNDPREVRARMITEHLVAATRIARKLLKGWGAWIEREEVESICALALCEAASRYDPQHGTTFLSYSFYYLKGALIKAISHHHLRGLTGARGREFEGVMWSEGPALCEDDEFQDVLRSIPDERTDLVHDAFRAELRACAMVAFERLNKLEREVIAGIHLLDFKVASFARSIGYSRGHISMVRRDAFEKVRPLYEPFMVEG